MSGPLYIGIMSGTSMDAVDTVIVDFSEGAQLVAHHELALPEVLRTEIIALNRVTENELARSQQLSQALAYLFAEAVEQLLADANIRPSAIRAIGSHGQTLRHQPEGKHGYSLQIGCGHRLAELTGICVVNDFRNRDIAANGQGAPLVPAFHQAFLHSTTEHRAIVNIGGMANVTLLDDQSLQGFDTGPGNVLLDYWYQQHHQGLFDREGQWAATGQVIPALLDAMLSEKFFALSAPKSTGRERFNADWLHRHIQHYAHQAADVQATLLELTARTIADALNDSCQALYLCGGGAFNKQLRQRLHAITQLNVEKTDNLGIDAQWMEAIAFAWLAKQRLDHIGANSPAATGASGSRILGAIYSA